MWLLAERAQPLERITLAGLHIQRIVDRFRQLSCTKFLSYVLDSRFRRARSAENVPRNDAASLLRCSVVEDAATYWQDCAYYA